MKHTKGKVVIDKYGSIVTENGSKLLVKGIEIPLGQHEEAEANAELIAEAFNVTNECGLTPRQLFEQRNELLDVLEELYNSMNPKDVTRNKIFMNIPLGKNYVGSCSLPDNRTIHMANDLINKLTTH